MTDDLPISRAFLESVLPVVLVGGKSRRFGRDKLVEPWGGHPIVHKPIQGDALIAALIRAVGTRR